MLNHHVTYPSYHGRALVEMELELFAMLDHPNIIKVHEAFEDKHKIYFIIDELKGESLFDKIIENGSLSEIGSASIGAYLVSIIRYLHKKDIVIRNLRPELILFDIKDGLELKLIDLSLAKQGRHYTEYAKDEPFDKF